MNDEPNPKSLGTITFAEMSTVRMQHGEPYIAIWVVGPRGGHVAMHRIDVVEAFTLIKKLQEALQ